MGLRIFPSYKVGHALWLHFCKGPRGDMSVRKKVLAESFQEATQLCCCLITHSRWSGDCCFDLHSGFNVGWRDGPGEN